MIFSVSDPCVIAVVIAFTLASFFRLLIKYIDKLGDDDYKQALLKDQSKKE